MPNELLNISTCGLNSALGYTYVMLTRRVLSTLEPIGGVYRPHTFIAGQQYLNLHEDISD